MGQRTSWYGRREKVIYTSFEHDILSNLRLRISGELSGGQFDDSELVSQSGLRTVSCTVSCTSRHSGHCLNHLRNCVNNQNQRSYKRLKKERGSPSKTAKYKIINWKATDRERTYNVSRRRGEKNKKLEDDKETTGKWFVEHNEQK